MLAILDSVTREDSYIKFVEVRVNARQMAKHQPDCFLVLARVYSPSTLKWSPRCLRFFETNLFKIFSPWRVFTKSFVFIVFIRYRTDDQNEKKFLHFQKGKNLLWMRP